VVSECAGPVSASQTEPWGNFNRNRECLPPAARFRGEKNRRGRVAAAGGDGRRSSPPGRGSAPLPDRTANRPSRRGGTQPPPATLAPARTLCPAVGVPHPAWKARFARWRGVLAAKSGATVTGPFPRRAAPASRAKFRRKHAAQKAPNDHLKQMPRLIRGSPSSPDRDTHDPRIARVCPVETDGLALPGTRGVWPPCQVNPACPKRQPKSPHPAVVSGGIPGARGAGHRVPGEQKTTAGARRLRGLGSKAKVFRRGLLALPEFWDSITAWQPDSRHLALTLDMASTCGRDKNISQLHFFKHFRA